MSEGSHEKGWTSIAMQTFPRGLRAKKFFKMDIYIYLSYYQLEPHKAVAEVSKIGNL